MSAHGIDPSARRKSLAALSRLIASTARRLVRRIGGRAYLILAGVFSLLIVTDSGIYGMVSAAETRLFDLLVSKRILVPPADPDIIIVDIDEASLATMAPQHGRWPWPNSVLGELVSGIERQGPRAIVFDILFSDADILRPGSDAAFNAVIAKSRTTFFPILRLDPQNDHLSGIRPGMLPGTARIKPESAGDKNPYGATLAMILPKVPAAIDNGRLGTHQVNPDKDGVIRRYPAWLEHDGWRIPSMPQRIAEEFGFPGSAQREVLLNWRGPPFTYQFVSFADVYRDFKGRESRRPRNEFARKIVIIGSTAPSLFDVKGTPLAHIHPGVEVLATAIDNFKNDDWLRERPRWLMVSATLLLIWGMSIALYKQVRIEIFDTVFGGLQGGLMLVAYATVNLAPWYLDFSAPLSLGVIFFTVVRVYHGQFIRLFATAGDDDPSLLPSGRRHVAVMAIELKGARAAERRRLKGELDRFVTRSRLGAGRTTHLIADPGPVHSAFSDVMLVYWLSEDAEVAWAREAATLESDLRNSRQPWARRLRFGYHDEPVAWNSHAEWHNAARRIFLRALVQITEQPSKETS